MGLEGGPEREHVKVHVTLPEGASVAGESLWATPVAGEPGLYEIDNVPFFAEGVNLGDVVRAEPVERTLPELPGETFRVLEVREVVRPSGKRTFVLVMRRGTSDAEMRERLAELRAVGCEVEWGIGVMISLTAPPELLAGEDEPAGDLRDLLDAWEAVGLLEPEDAD